MGILTLYIIERVEPEGWPEKDAVRCGLKVFAVRTKKVRGHPVVYRICARNRMEVEGAIEYRHAALVT